MNAGGYLYYIGKDIREHDYLGQYNLTNVKSTGTDCYHGTLIFASKVPKEAEVVVSYKFQADDKEGYSKGYNCKHTATGIALVPKRRLEEKVGKPNIKAQGY